MPTSRRISRYRLEQVIGTGGFATVHRAVDERLDDTVAVKVLADNHSLDPDIRERFLSEGRILRRIDNHHVVRVHDIGETEMHQPFLVLEYADRGTLARRVADLRSRGWSPRPDDVRVVTRPLAGAVEAVHRAQVVHRDLSPRNILLRSTTPDPRPPSRSRSPSPAPRDDPASAVVTADERLLLADLGLCKDLAVHSGPTVASGTEGFRAPEQRGPPTRVDARADLWALSALLVWLITGDPPDGQRVVTAVSAAGFSRSLGEALETSLADDPRRRHPDVATWLEAVEDGLAPAARLAPAAHRSSATDEPTTARPSRRQSATLTIAALAVGAVLGAGAMLATSTRDDPATVVTRLGDNQIEAVFTAGAARLAIIGPAEARAGETVTFDAEQRDVDGWVWLMPDGTITPDAAQVQLRTQSSGVARITLIGSSSAGDRLEAVHDLVVTEG
jgi:eukaryotic-like serine/threonine-protein kinase